MAEVTAAVPTVAPELSANVLVRAGVSVDFAGGIQGWTCDCAELNARRDGGPRGAGVLEIYTPGDEHDGYLIAPDALLGDRSGNACVRVTIKTENGRCFDAF